MFSRMKHVTNKIRSYIVYGHLEQCKSLATTSLEPDIDCPVREKAKSSGSLTNNY